MSRKQPQSRVDTEADLGEIRHAVDIDSLTKYLVNASPSDFEAPIVLKQFGYGQSNPSYQITDAKGRKYVLRKQPPGALVSKSAHRVDREFLMIKALHSTGKVPVPRVITLCQDKKVIGTDFYVMEFIQGRIFHDPTFPSLSPKDKQECWDAAIRALSQLHSVDPRNIGLPESFTKNMSSHYPRQTVTLAKVEAAQAAVKDDKTGKELGRIPNFDQIIEWMKSNMPQERVAIVHGDYKIDNLIFHPTENRVIAILDWELCTIGHPLADLGNLLHPYMIPGNGDGVMKGLKNVSQKNWPAGLPALETQLATYAKYAGWNPAPLWPFAVVYAHLRLSVITHGIAARLSRGQASSAHAKDLANAYLILSKLATDEIAESKTGNSKL